MKSEFGITMIELVIVLVIILIIATVAVGSGNKALNEADATEIFVEMDSMRDAINAVILRESMQEDFRLEEGVYYDSAFVPAMGVTYGDNVLGSQDDWRVVYGVDVPDVYRESTVRDTLGMEAINHTYIVNYETAEVELYKPVVIKSVSVRTYDEVRSVAR